MGFRNHTKDGYLSHVPPSGTSIRNPDDAILPRKPHNPVLESLSHRELHRELLLSHRRGLVLGAKPELQRVLQQRRLDRRREQEQALLPPSDLEQALRKQKQKLHEYEQEEERRREELASVPEFVRVKENLRHIQLLTQ